MNNKHVLTGVFLLGAAGGVSAADERSVVKNLPMVHDWSGGYVGVQVGHGWGESNFHDNEYNGAAPFEPVSWDADSSGLLAGIQAGYNWQQGRRVFGVEAELGRLKLDESSLQPGVDIYGDAYDASTTIRSGTFAGLSARLGYARDRTLFYAKAGAVYSNLKVGFLDTCTASPCGDGAINISKKVGWGYQVGAGVEHAVSKSWTLKAEYAYLDFGNTTITGDGTSGIAAGNTYNIRSDLSVHTFRFGANYQF